MAERELAIIVRARDLASKTIKGVNRQINNLGRTASRGLGHVTDTLKTLATVGTGVVIAGLGASVKAAADFESQMNTINTVAAKSPQELAKIGQGIRDIAKATGTPLADLTAGFYDLVSAGVDASQAQKVLAASNTLAIGGLSTAAEGVDLLTTALNGYGISAKDQGRRSEEFADIFAKAIERGKVTAADLAATFAQVGPLAHSSGIEIREVAAGYAQLTAKGVPAAEAATEMRAAMISLIRTTGPLEKLQKQTGKNYAAIASKKGLVAAFEEMRKDAAKAGVPLIELVGRQEALAFAINTTGKELPGYNANLAAMGDATGTAARQMAERQKGLNAQLAKLKALAIDAGITIGEKLLPKLTPLAEKAVAFLNTHQADISAFGDKIAAGFDKAAQFAGEIDWAAIGTGLQTGAEWAGKLIKFFNEMPDDVKTTIVALAGLNKLSGGAISGIVGELGKGLIKGVLSMAAGVVNINAGTVNGGGPGMGPGGPGSKGGFNPLSLIPLVAVAGIELAIADAIGPGLRKALGVPAGGQGGEIANVGGVSVQAGVSQAALVHPLNTIAATVPQLNEKLAMNNMKQAATALAVQRAGERTAGSASRAGVVAANAIKEKDLSVTVSTRISIRNVLANEKFLQTAVTHQ